MATTTTRIKDIPTTATTAASDDYFMVDGATNGTRKYAHNADAAAHSVTYASAGELIYSVQGLWSPTSSGRTITQEFNTRGRFYGLKLLLMNYSASSWTVGPAKVAACPASGLAGNHASLTGKWVSVTFGGQATGAIPAMVGNVPGVLESDLVAVDCVARTDGGTGYLLQSRIWLPATTEYLRTPNGGLATLNSRFGLTFGSNFEDDADGSKVTTPSGVQPSAAGAHWAVSGIRWYGSGKKSLVAFGDSISAGSGSTNSSVSDSTILSLSDGSNFSIINLGAAGRVSAVNYAQIFAYVTANKPPLVKFYLWSPNDGWTTESAFTAAFTAGLAAVDYCLLNRARVVICTSAPHTSVWNNSTYSGYWLAHNAKVREVASKMSVTLLDVAAILTGSTTATQPIAGMMSADNIHPSDAGYAAIAAGLAQVIA